jgi:hypothetical protein
MEMTAATVRLEWPPAEPVAAGEEAEAQVLEARRALHDLAQSMTLLIGTTELFALLPQGTTELNRLVGELPRVAHKLTDAIDTLRDTLDE